MRLAAISLALPLSVFVAAPLCAQKPLVQGSAFVDQNRNGRRDPGERGLANVSVSNQDAVVATDSAGEFRIEHGPNDIVFVSVPDDYQVVGRFWRNVADLPPRVEFALVEARSPDVFTFAHASDTHISPASVNRTQRLRTIVDSMRPAFLLIAGDLVKDALRVPEAEATSYYNLFMQELGRFVTPAWTVPGNHENFGIEQNLSHVEASHPLFGRKMYHHFLGPDYYSFTYGGVHFVGLNTVDIDGPSYYGHVDSVQLAWLARDLARIPSAMPVVTFDHIPMASTMETLGGYTDAPPAPTLITVRGKTVFRHVVSNAAEVLAVLRARPHVLALGAHVHAGEKISLEIGGVKTRFEQSPAVIGPSQLGPLTFPSGFTLYTVRKGVIDAGQFVPLVTPAAAPRVVTPVSNQAISIRLDTDVIDWFRATGRETGPQETGWLTGREHTKARLQLGNRLEVSNARSPDNTVFASTINFGFASVGRRAVPTTSKLRTTAKANSMTPLVQARRSVTPDTALPIAQVTGMSAG